MEEEKSSKSSSFEDLSNLKDEDLKPSAEESEDDGVIDVVGNKQLLKKTLVKGTDDTRPERTSVCKVSIVGHLDGSDKIVEEHKNVTVQLGDYEVVQGIFLKTIKFIGKYLFDFRTP